MLLAVQAQALEPVSISRDDQAIDILPAVELRLEQGESVNISTAPDVDGIVRRVEVRSTTDSGASNWAVFALANNSSEQIDRLIVAPHYRHVGSGLFWPDLDSERIVAITPSEGFSLETVPDREADVFLITLDPGAVITLIAELQNPRLPALYLWEPEAYKDTVNSYTLYRGIVLGISGLLAVFLTILFVVKGSAVVPATAALAWGVLAYICVDFGFWDRVVKFTSTTEPVWRAGTEVFLTAALIVFVYAYLNLNRWHSRFSTVALAWLLGLILLLGFAVTFPAVASGISRVSFAAAGLTGAILILYMALHGYDRAVMLIPTWILILAWIAGSWLTVTGSLANDIIQPALSGGLVLIVMLLGFTVMQHTFAGGGLAEGLVSDVERQAIALAGSGDNVWDWDSIRDSIFAGSGVTEILGLPERSLNGPVKNWVNALHPNDRDRFRATLDAIVDQKRGRIFQNFRLRSDSGQYYWFRLKARPLLDLDGKVIRCVGTVADVTDAKNAEERLLRDSITDNLTGLENRQLFMKRLDTAIAYARQNDNSRPSVFHINIDEFRQFNEKHGIGVGDTILLTAARRLGRLLRAGDSLARLDGDQFAILLVSESSPEKIAAYADSIRRTLRAPLQFAGEEIALAASIGIATLTAEHSGPEDLVRDAELAMIQAKRNGGNRIEPFRPTFRTGKDDSTILLDDLRYALENRQIYVEYQPILRLNDRIIIGFEALMRWEHPKLGVVAPSDFVPIAEKAGLIGDLGYFVLETAAREFAQISARTGNEDIFVSVNLSSRQLLRSDLETEIASVLRKTGLPASMLRIELTESLVMENPEHSADLLGRIKELGIGLSMDDFGTGYSSLSYLLHFPFDTIKIDRSFIQARERSERIVILRSIIAMAKGLNRYVIAEGIEKEQDVAELIQLNCEFGQGYYFGEPMSASETEQILVEEFRMAGQ
jgi:diguanylate cyclase (GGDEF)-like protein/PAS domain S-box-containing protein